MEFYYSKLGELSVMVYKRIQNATIHRQKRHYIIEFVVFIYDRIIDYFLMVVTLSSTVSHLINVMFV